jgi:hypothetical protein
MMNTNKPDFIKAAIYIASEGEQAGKYVATCAKDKCDYTGKSSYCYVFEDELCQYPKKCL